MKTVSPDCVKQLFSTTHSLEELAKIEELRQFNAQLADSFSDPMKDHREKALAILDNQQPKTIISDMAQIHPDSVLGVGVDIKMGVSIKYPITLGNGVTIDPNNSKIGEHIIIGNSTLIEEYAEIGSNVTIGDFCRIGGCTTIENGVNIPNFTYIPRGVNGRTLITLEGEVWEIIREGETKEMKKNKLLGTLNDFVLL